MAFESQRGARARVVQFAARPGVSTDATDELAAALTSIPWGTLQHAYGPAVDVPALLFAVTHGDDPVRADAWWELWGNIHHQGTVYEATPASVPFLAQIAADSDHPDRVNALSFLRQLALGDGEFAPQARAAVEQQLMPLLAAWRQEPELVQRALLLLASAFPERLTNYPELTSHVPGHLRTAWDELAAAGGDPNALTEDDESDDGDPMDRQEELERWLLAGWNEPANT